MKSLQLFSGQKRSSSKNKSGKSKRRSARKDQNIDAYNQQQQSSSVDVEDFDIVSKKLIGRSPFKRVKESNLSHQQDPGRYSQHQATINQSDSNDPVLESIPYSITNV